MNIDNYDIKALARDTLGDSPEMADELLALVLVGKKTATCWAANAEGPSMVDSLVLIQDGQCVDKAVLRITAIEKFRFCDVTADIAFAEGEGDQTLAYWRATHQLFFERNGGFSHDMELWCEHFELVATL